MSKEDGWIVSYCAHELPGRSCARAPAPRFQLTPISGRDIKGDVFGDHERAGAFFVLSTRYTERRLSRNDGVGDARGTIVGFERRRDLAGGYGRAGGGRDIERIEIDDDPNDGPRSRRIGGGEWERGGIHLARLQLKGVGR